MILSATSVIIDVSEKKKRKTNNENYFDVKEELAVRMFLTATT
jgi:hypothetical protein